MNNFWEGSGAKKELKPKVSQVGKRVSVDGISFTNKNIISQSSHLNCAVIEKKSKRVFWPVLFLFLTLSFIITFIFSGIVVAEASKDKLNVLNLLKSGKYLVLLQNNAEIRPSGGFIGSFAVIEFNNFQVKNIDFNSNIYKLDLAYTANHIIPPPKPIERFTDKWALRDSNFAVSFPEAARQIQWFYNQETGENIDGVITINASVVKDLLRITGPIELKNYNTTLTSENFFTALSTEVEKDYFKNSTNRDENEPKTILKELLPILVNKLKEKNKIDVIKQIYEEISQKQILFYSNNKEIENSILLENWGGEIKNSTSDYLSINNANFGGTKSSLSIIESIDYKVINNGETLIGDLTIIKSHSGNATWPDGRDFNYMRVLVPVGSTLNSAVLNGKSIIEQVTPGEEAGKTYFSVWTDTAPGTSNVINLKYNLPITDDKYSLLIQKQSGNLGDKLTVKYKDKLLYDNFLLTDLNIKPN